MKRKYSISLTIGAVLSIIGFYWSFRNVPVDELLAYLRDIDYVWLIPAAVIGFSTYFFRALRWRIILSANAQLSFSSCYHPMMIGFMINSVLPARVGELARPAILKQKENVPFSFGITTVGTERILDAITLLALLAWMLSTVQIDPNLEVDIQGYHLSKDVLDRIAGGMIGVSAGLGVLVVAMNIPAFQRLLKAGVLKIPVIFAPAGETFTEKLYHKFCLPLTGIIDNIASGLSLIRHPQKLVICIIYSLLIWLLQAVAFQIVALGSPLIDISFTQMTMVFIIICFFIMLPSVPGYWGIWEAGGVFGLSLFGVGASEALGFSLTVHVVLLLPVVVAGIISAIFTSINIMKISYGTETQQ